jgi:hypothetical protein
MGAGGKFENTVTLANNFWVEWPKGPLFHTIGYTVDRVEVWLMQKSTGAIQMTYTTAKLNLGSWEADQIWWPRDSLNTPPWKGIGRFQRGAAMGTAVAISTSGLNQSYFWWSEEVEII